jgi:hypothetical protein
MNNLSVLASSPRTVASPQLLLTSTNHGHLDMGEFLAELPNALRQRSIYAGCREWEEDPVMEILA